MGKASRKRRERMEQVQQAREIEGLVKRARLWDLIPREPKNTAAVIDAGSVMSVFASKFSELTKGVVDPESVFKLICINAAPAFGDLFIEGVIEPDEFPFLFGSPTRFGIGIAVTDLTQDGDWIEHDESERWVLGITFNCLLANGNFGASHTFCQMWLNHDGQHTCSFLYPRAERELTNAWENVQHMETQVMTFAAGIALFALSFLNCRNIVTVDHEPDPADNAAYQRHFGVPMTTYKTLAIKPMGKRYERDGEQKQFDVMPLHIRRGNFAHYTDDAPLFGKYTGTFWRPATAVGDAKNGIRVKDYEVKP